MKEHSLTCPKIPYHPYKILIKGSGSGKTNALLYLISRQPDIDKIFLYTKHSYEAKYQFLITKREGVDLKGYNDPKVFIEYSNNIDDIYENSAECSPNKERKILIEFADVIVNMLSNKNFTSVVTESFNKSHLVIHQIFAMKTL